MMQTDHSACVHVYMHTSVNLSLMPDSVDSLVDSLLTVACCMDDFHTSITVPCFQDKKSLLLSIDFIISSTILTLIIWTP